MALDEFQLPFCQSPKRALRLLAPAGSGKTHALLLRCLHQWESASKPKPRFLVFTFTRAARDELLDRLQQDPALAKIAKHVEVTTLNAWGYKRLKSKSHNLKLISGNEYNTVHNTLQPAWNKHPRLKQALEGKSKGQVAKVIIEVMDGLKSLGFRHDQHHKAAAFAKHLKWVNKAGLFGYFEALFQRLKDIDVLDAGYSAPNTTPKGEISPKGKIALKALEKNFLKFWNEATERMYKTAVITLEDQKYWAWLQLEESIAKGKFTKGIHRYDHILVDEFQDVNCLDLLLLKSIAATNETELTVVGDDDQAIYEWRGASPQFILNPNDYVGKKFETHILSRNYRSPRNIVQRSQKLIRHNKRRVDKEMVPQSKKDAEIEVVKMESFTETVNWVLAEVKKMLKGSKFGKVALIGRKRSQIIPYQIVFANNNIRFYAAEDLQIFLSDAFKELKEIIAIKSRATQSRGKGIDCVNDLLQLCDKVKRFPLNKTERAQLSLHLNDARPKTLVHAVQVLLRYTGPLKGENRDGGKSRGFAKVINSLLKAKTVAKSIMALSKNFEGLKKDYGKSIKDIFYTDPPFLYLSAFAERYDNRYAKFINDIDRAVSTLALIPGANGIAPVTANPGGKPGLHLMTALRAKGKEFDAVILLDVNEDMWPSILAKTPEQLEQERRVFYVAMTRAKKRLVLTVNKRMLDKAAQPSPYLAEMGL